MRRGIAISVLVCIVLSTGTVAANRRHRVEEANYVGGGIHGVLGVNSRAGADFGAVTFSAGDERYVRVKVRDDSGLPTVGEVAQNLDVDVAPEISHTFCGTTPRPVRIKPGVDVVVYLYSGTCSSTQPAIATTGAVRATFLPQR